MKKKIFILFIASFIAISQPVYTYADAASLTIIGATGTGGLTTASLSAFLPEVAAVIGGVLLAKGINVYLTNASEAQGKTKTQFIKDSIESYCVDAGKDTGEFCGNILNDIKVGNQGLIELGSQAREQIKQFVNWLYENNKVEDTHQNLGNGISIGNYNMPTRSINETIRLFQYTTASGVVKEGVVTYVSGTSEIVAYVIANANNGWKTLFAISNTGENKSFTVTLTGGTITRSSTLVNGYYYYNIQSTHVDDEAYSQIPYYNVNINDLLNSGNGVWNPGGSASRDDTYTGSQAEKDALDRALSPSGSDTSVLNPNILQDLINSLGGISDAMMNIMDYLDALGKAIDGVSGGIRVKDRDTDIPQDITYDPDEPFDPDLDTDPTDDTAQPVIDPNTPADVNLQIDPLKMNLKTIFPFCIPFDVVDMVKLLNAEPVAPTYTVNWNIPIINQTLNFTVDLSPFNNVAAILRNLEVIIFCIGLAMVTRSMFIRG